MAVHNDVLSLRSRSCACFDGEVFPGRIRLLYPTLVAWADDP